MNSESEVNEGVSGKMKKYLQVGIWWFSLFIFVGYVLLWIVRPTNIFYLRWFPDIEAKADSVYLGEQGLLLSLSHMLQPCLSTFFPLHFLTHTQRVDNLNCINFFHINSS